MSAAAAARGLPRAIPLVAGGGLIACACLVALGVFTADALEAWLSVVAFWTALPIGAVGLLAMLRLIPGRWNAQLSVFAEAGALLLPLAALALVPVLAGQGALYPWVDHRPPEGFPRVYLEPWFFAVRSVLWLLVLGLLALFLVARRGRAKPVSAIGLIAYPTIGTLIATDWLMSLEPEFHSSGFGLYVIDIQLTIALLAICLARLLARRRPLRSGLLGGLVLTALLLWGYFAFMQYFIIWSADRPHGVRWYHDRASDGWEAAFWAIFVMHAVPACMLLDGSVRRHRGWLIVLVSMALGGKLIETMWLTLPGGAVDGGSTAVLLALAGHVGLGALTVAGFLCALRLRLRRRTPRRAGGLP